MFYKYAPNRRIMVVNGHDSQRTWQLWHKTTTYSLFFVHILPNALLHHFLFFHFNENTTRGLWKKCNIGQILLWNVIIILLISWITVKMGFPFPFFFIVVKEKVISRSDRYPAFQKIIWICPFFQGQTQLLLRRKYLTLSVYLSLIRYDNIKGVFQTTLWWRNLKWFTLQDSIVLPTYSW